MNRMHYFLLFSLVFAFGNAMEKSDKAPKVLSEQQKLDLKREMRDAVADKNTKKIIALIHEHPAYFIYTYKSLGQPLMEEAIMDDMVEVVALLLEKGADPNLILKGDAQSGIPLRVACMQPKVNYQLIELLLKKGANPDIPAYSLDGGTLLHDAIIAADEKLIDLLLAYGADPFATNDNGDTAFVLVNKRIRAAKKRAAVQTIFKENGYDPEGHIKKKLI